MKQRKNFAEGSPFFFILPVLPASTFAPDVFTDDLFSWQTELAVASHGV
jgi:hypothetical protein